MQITTDLKTLKTPSVDVEPREVEELSKKLIDTFVELGDDAVGLAMIQLGIPKNMFIVKLPWWNAHKVFINPKLYFGVTPIISTEGCLSFPGIEIKCLRRSDVEISYEDINGVVNYDYYGCKTPELSPEGFNKMLEAVVIQHEAQHLEGKTFYDSQVSK